FFDGSPQGAPKLVAPIRRYRAGPAVADLIKVTQRIERIVAKKLKDGAMQRVGARLRDGRDHTAGGSPIFRGGHGGVDLEFLDPIHSVVGSGRSSRGAVRMIVDIGSMQHEAVGIGAASGNAASRSRPAAERGA